MNRDCEEGFRLRRRFEKELREWGWFDAFEKAIEIMPVGLPKLYEFQVRVKAAASALFISRRDYADHMAHCIACSRRLVVPDAIALIQEKLEQEAGIR